MEREEFENRMPLIDGELAKKGVPIHARAFHAFPIVAPNYNGPVIGYGIDRSAYMEYEGPNLFDKINSWYKRIYGDRFNPPADRGKVPIILRNEIYLIRIPLVYGAPQIEILPLVKGLTPGMSRSLSLGELTDIQQKFIEGYSLVYKFEDLSSQLDAEEKSGKKRPDNPFLIRAVRDKDTAADCLEGNFDPNGAVFHSQQLAEKMLKAVRFHSTNLSENDIKNKYNHRILDIFKDVIVNNELPGQIEKEIRYIAQYKMDIRYTSSHIPKEEAVKSYWAGLRIGGWCATLLSGHERRI